MECGSEDVRRGMLAVLGGAGAMYLLVGWMRRRNIRERIEITRQRRERNLLRMEIEADRPQKHVDDPFTILDLPLADLTEKLRSGEVTPETVLSIYMKQALEVTHQVNCLTDYLPECEEQLERLQHETVRGPLYGVPISLKDNYDYKNDGFIPRFCKQLFPRIQVTKQRVPSTICIVFALVENR